MKRKTVTYLLECERVSLCFSCFLLYAWLSALFAQALHLATPGELQNKLNEQITRLKRKLEEFEDPETMTECEMKRKVVHVFPHARALSGNVDDLMTTGISTPLSSEKIPMELLIDPDWRVTTRVSTPSCALFVFCILTATSVKDASNHHSSVAMARCSPVEGFMREETFDTIVKSLTLEPPRHV